MTLWTKDLLLKNTESAENLSENEIAHVVDFLNENHPFDDFLREKSERKIALKNMEETKNLLENATQKYPKVYDFSEIVFDEKSLSKVAFFFTAGGEGQRLAQSLEKSGMENLHLENFTKATIHIKDFPENFGTLMINLSIIKSLSDTHGVDFPVIISLGPKGSTTQKVIPEEIKAFNNFGLKNLHYISQGERLHLSEEEKISLEIKDGEIKIAKNPDESGGPLVAFYNDKKLINDLKEKGVSKILIVQGTGIFNPDILKNISSVKGNHDCYILGLPRHKFEKTDQLGTIEIIEKDGKDTLRILEAHSINDTTRQIQDPTHTAYLPANSGMYIFDLAFFSNSLPISFYATAPKEISFSKKLSPKIGYSATDFTTFAKNPAVILISDKDFAVLKNVENMEDLSTLGKKFGLITLCEKVKSQIQ
ncbi:MAG: hypothetical protein RBS56_00165 [Candidatus Gracilibacteria bacterium]|jgi:hypothetical protein|nr:hypothetical protein [Candidatus Gracilibacteria bacterium]